MKSVQNARMNYCWIAVVFTEILFICSIAQSQIERKNPKEYSITDPKYKSIILAHVGPLTITAEEFLLNYEFGPAFPKRQKDSKQRYLNYMIYEKLIALNGYANGSQNRSDIKQVLSEIEEDLSTTELYKDEVVRGIKVSSKEIDAGVKKELIDLSIQWIFSTSEKGIREQQSMLDKGISFDSLFSTQLGQSINKDTRMMNITRFKLEQTNPTFAMMIDTLKPGVASSPFHQQDGWYIVRYGATPKNIIITQTDEMKMMNDIERVLVKHKSDSLSDRYVQKMLVSRKPVVIRTALNNVMMILAKQILEPNKFSSWKLNELPGNQNSTGDSASYELCGRKELVKLLNGSYTVNDFLVWYKGREMNLKLDLKGPQEFFVSLEPLIWRMVRDKLLIERSIAKGFQHKESVQKQKKWWEDKLVYQAEKEKIKNSISLDDSLVSRFYHVHANDYKDSIGMIRSFPSVKDDVLRDYYASEIMSKTVHQVLQLKKKYAITVQQDELNKLYVDTENQPRAIDVYAVKPGGTLPRPAFPSIDFEWQSWN